MHRVHSVAIKLVLVPTQNPSIACIVWAVALVPIPKRAAHYNWIAGDKTVQSLVRVQWNLCNAHISFYLISQAIRNSRDNVARRKQRIDSKLCSAFVVIGHSKKFQYQRYNTTTGRQIVRFEWPQWFQRCHWRRLSNEQCITFTPRIFRYGAEFNATLRLYARPNTTRSYVPVMFNMGSSRWIGIHIAAPFAPWRPIIKHKQYIFVASAANGIECCRGCLPNVAANIHNGRPNSLGK